jgi:hypothetical protein
MTTHHTETPLPPLQSNAAPLTPQPSADLVPLLVAKVYEEAPPAVRGRLLEHLLKPLSVLSLAAVANGIFARITFSHGWSKLQVSAEDAQAVAAGDVVALVNHVQQVSVQAVDGLSKIVSTSPVLTGSAAAALLITLLSKRAMQRPPVVDNDFDPIA